MTTTTIDRKTTTGGINANVLLEYGTHKPHIVIIEDDYACRDAMQLILSMYFTLTVFENAEDALEYLRTYEHKVDLILSDNMLPGMSGVELAAAVKGDPKLAYILFIVQSAAIETIRSPQKHADLYMQKKFSCKDLVNVIEKILTDYSSTKQKRGES